VCPPGVEAVVANEISTCGFEGTRPVEGGVLFQGDPLRANRLLATPTRILQRLATFEAHDFAALQRGTAAVDWARSFPGVGFTPEVTCHRSRLYHTGAVAERVAALVPPGPIGLFIRIVDDLCTLSVDTSGERLHRRGWRVETGPAPLRETLAATLLRLAGWQPGETLYDPMCGAGTFLIEAATWAAGLAPGRLRTFACEAWLPPAPVPRTAEAVPTSIAGSDRARPAVEAARRNAERAGAPMPLSVVEAAHARPTDAPPGLLICNPPYDRRAPGAGHAIGRLRLALDGPFATYRAALLLPDARAAHELGRPVGTLAPLDNGGLRVHLVLCPPLR
jgi:putative N6-adenine-specific DNA methylase